MDAIAQRGFVRGSLEGEPRRHMGHLFDWKAVGESTGGALALIEIDGWRGGEPPIHYHTREDEFFYLLDGEATFKVGEELKAIGAGGFVWAPRNVPHGFAFTTESVRMLVGFLPAGQEDVFHRFSTSEPERRRAAEPDPATLPDLAELEAADNAAGVVYVGPPLAELLEAASG